uniref:Myb/SANT-like DNA-binding domain-containing protein n=1 Tax=Anopheles dirus TaxID=7168 RepID=A0A182NJ57_9DIPT
CSCCQNIAVLGILFCHSGSIIIVLLGCVVLLSGRPVQSAVRRKTVVTDIPGTMEEDVAGSIDAVGAIVNDLSNPAAAAAQQQLLQQDFKWSHERCLLLLHEYDLLKDKFKDRKHKKKDLWAEISMKFKKIYAYDLEWDVAYKKFRNLKQTFEQVRAKMHQQAITGQVSTRPKWPYFEKFQQILDDPGIVAYSFADHHLHQQQVQQQVQEQQLQKEEPDQHPSHHHTSHPHHHHHLHHHHHQQLDPATVGQVLVAEDFSDTLVTVFPMDEELEIPTQPAVAVTDDSVEGAKVEQEELAPTEEEEEEVLEEDEVVEEAVDEMEAPHRKRFRRLSTYEQERLEIEREKLDTLREIQRGIECKNDILRGILHVLQSRVWQAHPPKD